MKTGLTIAEMLQTTEDRAARKADFVTDSKALSFTPDSKWLQMVPHNGPERDFLVSDHTHGQIAQRLGIPKAYYDRMKGEAPDLLAANANRWFGEAEESRFLRTMDGTARAFLSDKYRPIEHEEVMSMALEGLARSGQEVQLAQADVTDSRLYFNVLFPKFESEIGLNDPVRFGLTFRNSEIGSGAFEVLPFMEFLVCLNGMVSKRGLKDSSFRRSHLGGRLQADSSVWQADTIKAENEALGLQVRDTIAALSAPDAIAGLVDRMKATNETRDVVRPTAAIEIVAKRVGLVEAERERALELFLTGDGGVRRKNLWGLVNAVTGLANEAESMDRAQELQSAGGALLDMSQREWQGIQEAELEAA